MIEILTKLLSGVVDLVVNVCLTAIAPMAVVAIGSWFNQTRLGKKTMIDDDIFKAIEIGVSNVGQTVAKQYKKAKSDGVITDNEKRELQGLALKTARETMTPEAIKVFNKYTPERIQDIVRFVVDQISD